MQKQQEKQAQEFKKTNVFGPVATEFTSADTGSWRLERPVVRFEDCIKCGTCEMFCPANVMTVYKDGREACVEIDYDYCKGCGICVNECPKQCIDFVPERGNE
jgi:2-oxoacid:acceptor oxidoreductase delta subunit (pyruvate/2-ketoisovalerate family)